MLPPLVTMISLLSPDPDLLTSDQTSKSASESSGLARDRGHGSGADLLATGNANHYMPLRRRI
ncbi:MAG: hypothetical protein IPM02_20785 [Betaproteobacteria bacterium]|nr:hypothetical protein [Betaproteobacteria bacterium]